MNILTFLKEIPHIYLLFVLLIIELSAYGLFHFDFLRDTIVGTAGAIVALSRITTGTSQIKTDTIENVAMNPPAPSVTPSPPAPSGIDLNAPHIDPSKDFGDYGEKPS